MGLVLLFSDYIYIYVYNLGPHNRYKFSYGAPINGLLNGPL